MRLFDAGARGDSSTQTVHDRVWTAANLITFVRLGALPLFVWLVLGAERYGLGFAVLAVIATTDWLDGYVARRFDQVTRLGRVLDPLIDRAMLATAAVTLLLADILPWPVVVLIVVRDVVLLGSAFAMFGGLPAIPVSRTGKFSTASLLLGIPSLLLANLDWPGADVIRILAWMWIVTGLVGYYIGGIKYAIAAIRLKRLG